VILRPFNIYGPGQSKGNLIPDIISQLTSDKISLADPRPKRDLLFVSDLVSAYLKAANYKKKGCEVFNIGYGKSFSVKEIVEFIVSSGRSKAQISYLHQERKNEIMDVVADTGKACRMLGWKPKVSFYSGIKKTVTAKL
jgi:UDP-glucose 4-epimerase